ncbi:MAG: hypothetical protein HY002_17280 [Candidatus Rokubacteria bacterium]|nr:hypothetical protein [Candidatus Rokubacteria bacterium]
MVQPTDSAPEPIFTPRLQVGFGLLAFGVGLMFLAGKVLPAPLPAGIAGGISLAIAGFVVVVVEALRDPPAAPRDDQAAGDDGRAPTAR